MRDDYNQQRIMNLHKALIKNDLTEMANSTDDLICFFDKSSFENSRKILTFINNF